MEKKIYVLRRTEDIDDRMTTDLVIVADDENEARDIAFHSERSTSAADDWHDAEMTDCTQIGIALPGTLASETILQL